ncbi:MAG: PhnB protein; putative DNA binding 3-demethylubiquinone-9 3-methyltransferase domain protein [uncultured Chloroflexi bacterium]|uniref:PhnB protein putative DNA binding 3-demethylubiquinone-9 3-methyltransferase domain protein n=1 Tax=uncultured Chloroflexota bacterium TaxID=166587 RepID=A0A6J4I322_9CHLR|nr:MAG: PhnB protein; putative DNA binding 3-demethylubiquinone-9 3-methyltransferase domain protein [uncultured Chloroflexota bacterium]
MSRLSPYLHFDGTTRHAMEFYKDVLGGELEIHTVGETPWASDMPQVPGATPDKIMHSALSTRGWVIMAADMMDPSTFAKGDTVSLCLVCDSKQEIDELYAKLSADGDVFMALDKTPFGWYAQFTDKFGIDWMVQFQGE